MSKFNKKKLPSRHTSLGPDRAPHRSFYYAMGETEQDVAKPFVGVVSTWNEAAPCNTALMKTESSSFFRFLATASAGGLAMFSFSNQESFRFLFSPTTHFQPFQPIFATGWLKLGKRISI